MSDMSQGPGWWQASDGKWYAPEAHPNYQPPTAPQPPATPPPAPPAPPAPAAPPPMMAAPPQMGAPGYGPGPGYGPPPAKKSGGKGCLIAVIIVVILLIGAGGAAFVGLRWVGDQVDNGNAFGKTTCDAISKQDLDSTLNGNFEVLQLGGLTSMAGVVLDTRALPDGKTCSANESLSSSATGGRLIRIATSTDGDAAAKFQAEKTKAQGTKQDKGGGLSVETQGYFNKDVQAGDEAFCTTSDLAGSAGVLVRKGNELIYVSMTSGNVPTLDTSAINDGKIKLGDDDASCDNAQKVAAKIK